MNPWPCRLLVIACAILLSQPRSLGEEEFFLREPQSPVIPKAVFPVVEFGASGDGRTMNTAAIQAAIDA